MEEHASLKRIKFTQTPAPWMENIDVAALQRERDQLRYKAYLHKSEESWNSYRQIQNKIKLKINERKTLQKKGLHLKNI